MIICVNYVYDPSNNVVSIGLFCHNVRVGYYQILYNHLILFRQIADRQKYRFIRNARNVIVRVL